jgi:hypothetical protein
VFKNSQQQCEDDKEEEEEDQEEEKSEEDDGDDSDGSDGDSDAGDDGDDVPDVDSCFHADTLALVPSSPDSVKNPVLRKMRDLKAGDRVLAVNDQTGSVQIDRVSLNLHLKDKDTTTAAAQPLHDGLTFVHKYGELRVTPTHLVLVEGYTQPLAAAKVRIGDKMPVMLLKQQQQQQQLEYVPITAINKWRGGIINPLTFGTRILAISPDRSGSGRNSCRQNTTTCAPDAVAVTTTVLQSPWNVQQTLLSLPGTMLRLVSSLYPHRFQESTFAEGAILYGCRLSVILKHYTESSPILEAAAFVLCLFIFLLVDLCCLAFLVFCTLVDAPCLPLVLWLGYVFSKSLAQRKE